MAAVNILEFLNTRATFIPSNKGVREVLVIAGYQYRWKYDRKRTLDSVYECICGTCTIKAFVDNTGVITAIHNHLHAPNQEAVQRRQVHNILKERAATSQRGTTRNIVANVLAVSSFE